jgi:hypothetical protein
MRTYDPNRASVKHVFEEPPSSDTPEIVTEPAPLPVVSAALPPEIPAVNELDTIVSVIREVGNFIVTSGSQAASVGQAENAKIMETLASQISTILKQPPSIPPSPQPVPYVFEIERDAQGRIAKIRANPVLGT